MSQRCLMLQAVLCLTKPSVKTFTVRHGLQVFLSSKFHCSFPDVYYAMSGRAQDEIAEFQGYKPALVPWSTIEAAITIIYLSENKWTEPISELP